MYGIHVHRGLQRRPPFLRVFFSSKPPPASRRCCKLCYNYGYFYHDSSWCERLLLNYRGFSRRIFFRSFLNYSYFLLLAPPRRASRSNVSIKSERCRSFLRNAHRGNLFFFLSLQAAKASHVLVSGTRNILGGYNVWCGLAQALSLIVFHSCKESEYSSAAIPNPILLRVSDHPRGNHLHRATPTLALSYNLITRKAAHRAPAEPLARSDIY